MAGAVRRERAGTGEDSTILLPLEVTRYSFCGLRAGVRGESTKPANVIRRAIPRRTIRTTDIQCNSLCMIGLLSEGNPRDLDSAFSSHNYTIERHRFAIYNADGTRFS